MNRRRRWTIKSRLAGLFFAITLVAIALVYLYVVPQLDTNLRRARLHDLAVDARLYSRPIIRTIGTSAPAGAVDRAVREAADAASARVTLLGVATVRGRLQLYGRSDSNAMPPLRLGFRAARLAARTGRSQVGAEPTGSGQVGEAARPLFFRDRGRRRLADVVVFSSPLGEVQGNVAVVRRQVLIAGGIALLFAVLAGYLVARALSQRIKRLERAACQVAAGDFSHPIPVDSDDELGQLAVAFNDMQRQLAQLDRARKQFIATASHELRTPIFSLGGFVELLQDEDLDDETRDRFLTQVRQQVDRLGKLSVDLLDLSRLDSGSLELRPEPVDVGQLAREVTREFEPALARHDSDLELRLTRRSIEAHCDPERIAQIMRILIDNALTHTPSGTHITVSAARENGAVRLAVRDRGRGIDRAALPLIFEPFYTSNDARGSGLGLAIASELAERMNGRLAVESSPGRTVFTLEIPA